MSNDNAQIDASHKAAVGAPVERGVRPWWPKGKTMENTPNDWAAPHWEDAGRVHEWKNYISEEVQAMWATFTDAQKQALARQAEENASREEWD